MEPKPPKSGDHQLFIDTFHRRFMERYEGEAPTWGAAPSANFAKLLKAHGIETCLKRVANAFDGPPAWMVREGTVLTNLTFVRHFDEFVVCHKPKSQGPRLWERPSEEPDYLSPADAAYVTKKIEEMKRLRAKG